MTTTKPPTPQGISARTFHVGDILSVLQPRMVSPGGPADIQALLEYMTSDSLNLHQLGRAADECRDSLAAQHPDLAAAAAGIPVGVLADRETGLAWLASLPGATMRPVGRLAAEDHTRIDPVTEARARYGVGFTSHWLPVAAPAPGEGEQG